ncbi:MAG TPA: metallophosphoesterase family protein [Vicinamibacterales bacterium]|jgi:diadenosine tetraphosphatase ApaH/serine/threonine PP2A family protein phosphatase
MQYLILSDIHGNLEALDAVLAAEPEATRGRVVVLGDLVGYGADPNAVIDRVRGLDAVAIRGNHDKVVCGLAPLSGFNAAARTAAEWTREALTPAALDYLTSLPAGPYDVDEQVAICHGAPFDEDAYLFDERDVHRAFRAIHRPLCLFGHTHVPVAWSCDPHGVDLCSPGDRTETSIALKTGVRYLVNPGSVGQPRDGDPRAAYARVDTEAGTLVLRRVAYAVHEAQQKILSAGLPAALAMRLARGR